VERLFRRLKGFGRIFSRFEKLDVVFLAFLYLPTLSRTAVGVTSRKKTQEGGV